MLQYNVYEYENETKPELPKGISYKAALLNAVLMPLKVHAFCCGVVPVLTSVFGSNFASEKGETPMEKIVTGLVAVPVITFGTILAEKRYHNFKQRHKEHKCCGHDITLKKFLVNTAVGYGLGLLTSVGMSLAFGDNHEKCNHPHDAQSQHHTVHNNAKMLYK